MRRNGDYAGQIIESLALPLGKTFAVRTAMPRFTNEHFGDSWGVKFIERFLQYTTAPWLVAYFLLPANIWSIGTFGLIFSVGLWTVLYPQGMLRVAKATYPGLDTENERLWCGARVIGVVFILLSILAVAQVIANSR